MGQMVYRPKVYRKSLFWANGAETGFIKNDSLETYGFGQGRQGREMENDRIFCLKLSFV